MKCTWTLVFIELHEKLLNTSKCSLKYSCLLSSSEILSTRKYFGYAFKNICDRMGNVWIYIPMDSVVCNELSESANARLQTLFWLQGQSLPSLCLPPVWTVTWRRGSTGLPVGVCQIQSCFPVHTMLNKMKWVVCLLRRRITRLSSQRCLTVKKMSDASICGTVRRCRSLNLEYFSS